MIYYKIIFIERRSGKKTDYKSYYSSYKSIKRFIKRMARVAAYSEFDFLISKEKKNKQTRVKKEIRQKYIVFNNRKNRIKIPSCLLKFNFVSNLEAACLNMDFYSYYLTIKDKKEFFMGQEWVKGKSPGLLFYDPICIKKRKT